MPGSSGTSPRRSRSSSSAASNSGRHRCRSWSSIRRITRPPVARAIPHVYSALTRWPRWRKPVGAGANRVTGAGGSTRGSGRAAPVAMGTNSVVADHPGRTLGLVSRRIVRHGSGRAIPAPGWRTRSAGRSTAGPPAPAAPGWPSPRGAAPRARAPGSLIARRPASRFARPAVRPSLARSLSSSTIRRSSSSMRSRTRASSRAASSRSCDDGRPAAVLPRHAAPPNRAAIASSARMYPRAPWPTIDAVAMSCRKFTCRNASRFHGSERWTSQNGRSMARSASRRATDVCVYPAALTIETSKSRTCSRSMRSPSWFDW